MTQTSYELFMAVTPLSRIEQMASCTDRIDVGTDAGTGAATYTAATAPGIPPPAVTVTSTSNGLYELSQKSFHFTREDCVKSVPKVWQNSTPDVANRNVVGYTSCEHKLTLTVDKSFGPSSFLLASVRYNLLL